MVEAEVITRRWGNSLGIAIPKDVVLAEGLKENQEIIIELKPKIDLRKLKGLVKFTQSAQELKDEMRVDWE